MFAVPIFGKFRIASETDDWRGLRSFDCDCRVSVVLRSRPFSQFLRISQVLGAAGTFLVSKQCAAANETGRDSLKLSFQAGCPRVIETDSGNAGQEVDAVRLHAQLDDHSDGL